MSIVGIVAKCGGENLRVNQTILGAGNQDKAFYLKKVGKFRWVEFSHTDGVAFLLNLSQYLPYPRNQWKVGG